jgi:hypothetical protein
MKVTAITLLAGIAVALPQGKPPGTNMISTLAGLLNKNGQLDGGFAPMVRNELTTGSACGDIVFIFARASMEPDNMVFCSFPAYF